MILVGDSLNDTQFVRQFILDHLKGEIDVDVVKISGSAPRTQTQFKNAFQSSQNTSVELKANPFVVAGGSGSSLQKKVLFFEDVD